MSKILNLAQDFEAKSKQQASDTEKALKIEFEKLEQSISSALNQSEQTIKNDIQEQNKRMKLLVLKSWGWIIISVALVFALLAATLWGQGLKIADNIQTIEHQNMTIAKLKKQGGNIKMSTCGDKKQLCIKIDLDEDSYGKNGVYPWKIPEGY